MANEPIPGNGVVFPLLSRAAATYTSEEFFNPKANGVLIHTTVSVHNGGTVTVKVQVRDPVSDVWSDVTGVTSAAIGSANQTRLLTVFPGLTAAAGSATTDTVANSALPVSWRVVATVATAAVTFSVGASYLAMSYVLSGATGITFSDSVTLTSGQFLAPNGSAAAPSYSFSGDTGEGFYRVDSNFIGASLGGALRILFGATSIRLRSDIGFISMGAGDDINLARDAANTLAQRNGTNAQSFRIYNTTDAGLTNYERLAFYSGNGSGFGTTSAAIMREYSGTGAATGPLYIGTGVGTGPVNLRMNNTNQFTFSHTGGLTFSIDNTLDIGASGATRPRTGYFGTSVITATFSTSSGGHVLGPSGLTTGASGSIVTLGGVALYRATAPTVASGFGTSPSIVAHNGSAAFTINVGTGAAASTGVITMPAATTGWACQVNDLANSTTHRTRQTATTTTSISLECYSMTTGIATPWASGAVIQCMCLGY